VDCRLPALGLVSLGGGSSGAASADLLESVGDCGFGLGGRLWLPVRAGEWVDASVVPEAIWDRSVMILMERGARL
jgi:hypothetical protein